MQGLAGYIVRRLLLFPVILFAVSIVTFMLLRLTPADYLDIQAGPRATPETKERIREELGLNDLPHEQYIRYMGNVVQGDLGQSVIHRGADIEDVILPRLWVSLQYNVVVLILTFTIGIPLGTFAAIRRGTWMDPFSIGTFLVFTSIPVLVSIPVLLWLFVLKLDWLPSSGWSDQEYLGVEIGLLSKRAILPILILTLPGIAGIARYMRAQVLDVLDQDFVRTARSKGLEEYVVISRHVVRNAMLPIATLVGFELAALFSGSLFVETFLGIPGIGRYAFDAIGSRDYDSVMAIVLLGSAVFMLANLLADLAYGFIDPRIRLSGQAES
jgi:ABC-type dipeptide/oligopeptide/nickel transport system permease component